MSSDGFAVDLEALGVLRDRVAVVAEELTEQPTQEAPRAETFGHRRLTEAVNEFATQEQRGRSQLASEAESIRHRLAETIKTYRQADDEGVSRFGGIGS
ncbi:hypothetical protein [Actinophytocola sediminis]